jgi:AraC-like DNA-binding protein
MVRRYREFGKKSSTDSVSVRKYELDSVADQLMIKADLLHVIALIYSFGMIEDKEVTDTEKQVKAVKDSITFIREHYKEKLYIRNLSELTGLNEQYFIRFFGSVTGISPLDYINRYRVEQAARLLKDTDTHVYEIAEDCGFHNIGNFIKIFRSVTGDTPHKFRKRFGKED